MTQIFWRRKVLLAKIETAYGVDPTLTGAANAILGIDVSIRPMEGQDVNRDLIRAFLSGEASIPTGLHAVIEFSTELAGSGTAGVAPAWGPLLRACAFAEVVAASTSVTYTPISDAMESIYIKFWQGGTLHALKGSRGTGVISVNAQGIPRIRWTFTGLFVAPSEASPAVPTLTAFKAPLIASKVATPTFTLDAAAMVMRSYTLNLGNQVQPRLLIGLEEVIIPDRAESLDVVVEATQVSAFNPYDLANAQTQIAAVIAHGVTAGNIVTITAPKCQVKRPTGYQNNQGVAEWPLNLSPLPTVGNDQVSIVLT